MKQLFTLVFLLFGMLTAQSQVAGSSFDSRARMAFAQPAVVSIDNFSVFPNPASDLLKLTLRASQQSKAKIFIINNIGGTVAELSSELDPGVNSIQVDLRENGVGRGVYFLVLEVDNSRFARKLIVK